MGISTTEMAAARETLNELLDQLGLPAYRFEVHPEEDGWQLTIECEGASGWLHVLLQLPREQLDMPPNDPEARQRLLTLLDEALRDCLRVV